MTPAMTLALAASFKSVDAWRSDFVATGRAQSAGSGAAVLAFQPSDGSLINRWAADAAESPPGAVPILALARADDEAVMASIDWAAVYARYQLAVQAASERCFAEQADVPGAVVIDVRRAGVFEQATHLIAGARWRDPARISDWASELPADRNIVVYCVYGHEVSRATALRLRARGLSARFLRGGIEDWQAAQRPLEAKR